MPWGCRTFIVTAMSLPPFWGTRTLPALSNVFQLQALGPAVADEEDTVRRE